MGICQSNEPHNNRDLHEETSDVDEISSVCETASVCESWTLSTIRSEVPVFAPLQGRMEARLCGIVDGDTLIAIIIFNENPAMIKIRVSGIDTPEKIGKTANSGIDATKSVYEFFDIMKIYDPKVKRQTVNTRKRFLTETSVIIELEFNKIKNFSDQEKFGRNLAKVYYKNQSLGDYLIGKGLAREYGGGTKNQDEWIDK